MTLHGRQHREFLDRLAKDWWRSDSPVAVLQGFPGSGKTEIALKLVHDLATRPDRIVSSTYVCAQGGWETLGDIAGILAEDFIAKGDGGAAGRVGDKQGGEAIRSLLLDRRLVVLDDVQHLLKEDVGPVFPATIADMIRFVAGQADLKGRLLILSSRNLGLTKWGRGVAELQLGPLSPEDSRSFLTDVQRILLGDDADPIPPDRLDDAAAYLGGNPRAMSLLASALRYEPFEQLIASSLGPDPSPGVLSPELLKGFEEKILKRAIERMGQGSKDLLDRLVVFRRPFPSTAIEAVAPKQDRLPAYRNDLIDRYVLQLRSRLYHIHPVVRGILIQSRSARAAHKAAGDYFAAAFGSKRIIQSPEPLSQRFMEAHHHYTRANASSRLQDISQRFKEHLRTRFHFSFPVPDSSEETEERITSLTTLLDDGGPEELQYHLASCLLARGRTGDAALALPHLVAATSARSPAAVWLLRIRITAQCAGTEPALIVAREACDVVPPDKDLNSIYLEAARLLAADHRIDEALALLREGIGRVPFDKGLDTLYVAAANVLVAAGDSGGAADLLLDGLRSVQSRGSSMPLLFKAADILPRIGRLQEAVSLLTGSVRAAPADGSAIELYIAAAHLMTKGGHVGEALSLLREGQDIHRDKGPVAFLYRTHAEILAAQGREEEALAVLGDAMAAVPLSNRHTLHQAAAEIRTRIGDPKGALETLRRGLDDVGRSPNAFRLVESEILLLADHDRLDLIDPARLDSHQAHLLEVMTSIVQGSFREAVAAALDGLQAHPDYSALAAQAAFAALAGGEVDRAVSLIETTLDPTGVQKGPDVSWLAAAIYIRAGMPSRSRIFLEREAGRVLRPDELTMQTVLACWEQSCRDIGSAVSYRYPRLPPSITGLNHPLVRHEYFRRGSPENDLPPREGRTLPSRKIAPEEIPHVLAVATEWSSGHGGLSTFNRNLCVALAREGARVACVVAEATPDEMAEAGEAGVTLTVPPAGPGLDGHLRLLRRPDIFDGRPPDLIVGHGRITGPFAASLRDDHFPQALRVHFLHMAPDEIEVLKEARDVPAGLRAETRTQAEVRLGRTAWRAFAVGPRLHARFLTDLDAGDGASTLLRFDPGFDVCPSGTRPPPPGNPLRILVLARAEDHRLKGLDIAAGAFAAVSRGRPMSSPRLELIVRGAPADEVEELRALLSGFAGDAGRGIVIRSFSASPETLQDDLRTASLVLMPSRSEGFGLAGQEAILAGTPLLASSESGLAMLLMEHLPGRLASPMIVDMRDESADMEDRWASAIRMVLEDRGAAFARAQAVRDVLSQEVTWQTGVRSLLDALSAERERGSEAPGRRP